CVKTREQPMAHAEIGHRTATICHLLNLAMLTEREIAWDPLKEKITNAPELHRMLIPPMRTPWHFE
ncbi:MAG: gfo/Idh/MocA family oxidoreductase, partial [bacterium]